MNNYEFARQHIGTRLAKAKKPKVAYRQYFCPECESKLIAYNWTGGIHFCHHCGQAIDWNNEKEMFIND